MNQKSLVIKTLKDEFKRWDELLARLSAEQIAAPLPSSHWCVKDALAHMHAWQQITIARLDAALQGSEPIFPSWLVGGDPNDEEKLQGYNERIYQANRHQPWQIVYMDWKEGFLRFLELAGSIPEKDLFEVGRYSWLKGYPLTAVLIGSYEHHQEHFKPLSEMFPNKRTSSS